MVIYQYFLIFFLVKDIMDAYEKNSIRFHSRIETLMFSECIQNYLNKRYISSATVWYTLYERIFTTRLIRETSNHEWFIPSKDNFDEQFKNLINREEEVVLTNEMSFWEILKLLKEKGILDSKEKREYQKVYCKYRNSILHWVVYKLYEYVFWSSPSNMIDMDIQVEKIYKIVSEIIITDIYNLHLKCKILKK